MTLRDKVYARDFGICVLCGIDTYDLELAVKACEHCGVGIEALFLAAGTRLRKYKRGIMWEADHIVPVSEGGSDDLSNLRTLCLECHHHQTLWLFKREKQRRIREMRHAQIEASIEASRKDAEPVQ